MSGASSGIRNFGFIVGFCAVSATSPAAAAEKAASPTIAGLEVWGDFVETNFPFFSSTLDARKLGRGLPSDNLTPRGLVLNLGSGCWACFDLDLLRISAIWTGDSVSPVSMAQISYHSAGAKAPEGQNHLPELVGEPLIATGIYPGWQAGDRVSLVDPRPPGPDPKEIGRGALAPEFGRFKALRLTQTGVCLEYEIVGIPIREWVDAGSENGAQTVRRHFRLDSVSKPLWLVLGQTTSEGSAPTQIALGTIQSRSSGRVTLVEEPKRFFAVRILPSPQPLEFSVGIGPNEPRKGFPRPQGPSTDTPPKARWPETLVTLGALSSSSNAYVVDNISLPVKNPWRRNIRLGDLAFFKNGKAAAATFDGDVWTIEGLHGDLKEVKWRRFASGLNEPQSLCIREEQIFVFDRNGLWRLRDTDGNGEADVHELFSNAFAQTAETREYAQSMKLAPDGSFILAKGGIQATALGKHNGSVLRVSADGKSADVLGWGLRSPYLGVHPKTGLITASDQQGHYVPTTPLHIIRDHQYYGFLSNLLPKEQYPAPIADPLTWIPYPINASGGCQTWLFDAKMGPLNEALIHFGYYRPEIFLVLLNQRTARLQASVLSITRDLEFSPFDGAVSPLDGQLYFTGFQIWGTTAHQLSGLARLRYTGAPSTLPAEVVPMDQGVLLRFNLALDPKTAMDPANFSAERWNYKRTAEYGSPHFKLDGSKGQEALVPSSAYLSSDCKRVFIGIPGMKPAMQMGVGWTLATRDGMKFSQHAYFTPYELARFVPASEGFPELTIDLTPKTLTTAAAVLPSVEEGKRVAELMGCIACHSTDGSTLGKVGPTWKGLYRSKVPCAGGITALADEGYLRESIREPAAKIVKGFEKTDTGMPSYEGVISDSQIEALILYIKTL